MFLLKHSYCAIIALPVQKQSCDSVEPDNQLGLAVVMVTDSWMMENFWYFKILDLTVQTVWEQSLRDCNFCFDSKQKDIDSLKSILFWTCRHTELPLIDYHFP